MLAFYGRRFTCELRGKSDTMSFIDLGDRFIAVQKGRSQSADDGRHVEIVGYDNIQFTKAPNVLRGMGLTHLAKNERAKQELAERGMSVVEN